MPLVPIPGSPGPDLIPGTPGDDQITGDAGDDTIGGAAGQDVIYAGAGADSVHGQPGHDWIFGGTDADTLNGDDGDDRIFGGDGSDTLRDGYGNDRLYGDAGDDVFFGEHGEDWFYGGSGRDVMLVGDTSNPGVSHAFGGWGDDLFYFLTGQQGEVDGGEGSDTLVFDWYTPDGSLGDVSIALSGSGAGASANGVALAIRNMEALNAQTYQGNDTVLGGGGNDQIGVHLGANRVETYAGTDRITYIVGGANVIDGGTGTDTLTIGVLTGPQALNVTVTGATATDSYGSVLTNIENFVVNSADGDDQLRFGAGNDVLYASGGLDIGWGGSGRDLLHGGNATDILYGDGGHDTLWGGNGADALFGGDGTDMLNGGADGDALSGGAGADQFRFSVLETGPDAGFRADTIRDFETGIDRILIQSQMLGFNLPVGALDPARLSFGVAVGSALQLVLAEGFADGASRLYLDWNGAEAGWETLLAVLEGAPTLTVTDVFVF